MTIQTLLIDDDQLNIDLLSALLKNYCPQIEILAAATNVNDGVQAILKHRPQLLFLDMELHNQKGFDILDALPHIDMQVVLITAHEKYAVQAFRYEVVDYLLKPIKIDELVQAVAKVEKNLEDSVSHITPQRISVSVKDHMELIAIEDIIFLESKNSATSIICKDGKEYITGKKLGHYDPLLNNKNFIRVHKSFIIHSAYVVGFTKHRPAMLAMSNGAEVPITPAAKAELQSRLGIL